MRKDVIWLSMKEIRERRGLTQTQIADRLEVDKSTVSKWESGDSTPLRKYRRKLCELLGCTEEELMTPASA
nr:MAG TPA: helix-turn-helix domain protein [Caudoviricetes sp.]